MSCCQNTNRISRMKPGIAHGEHLTHRIIGLAMRVHRHLGPGLLESAYQRCLCHELSLAGLPFDQQVRLPIWYDSIEIDTGYLADIVVNGEIILELKAVSMLADEHRAQILNYLHASGHRLGFLVNFGHCPRLEYERIIL